MPDVVMPDCRLVVIVTHPDRDAILMVAAPDGPAGRHLPSTMVSSASSVSDWIASVESLIGRHTVLLRHDTIAAADHDHPTLVVIEVEPVVPRTDLGTWHEVATLADDLADGPIRAAIDRWLARRRSGRPSARLP